jgi:hypothetical protein
MSMDEMLDMKITIREGINMGIITSRVLSDGDIFIRVQTVMTEEQLPKTHAIEKVAEMCRVSERTVWTSYSFTERLIAVR